MPEEHINFTIQRGANLERSVYDAQHWDEPTERAL